MGEQITCVASGVTYTIGSYIGQGNFGVVYKGTDDFDNDVAIKVLKPHGTYEGDRASAFGEFERLRLLRHNKITYVHDAFEYRGSFYIVTEWCGMTVGSVIGKPFVDERCIYGVARCVLDALRFIHNNRMVYLDLHANNVLFSWGRNELKRDELVGLTFKISDLGITKPEADITPAVTLANWMRPPEAINLAEFGPMDRRIDIYHCGLLLLQLLRGQRLELTQQEVLDGIPRQLALQLNEPYRTALEKALRRHVQARTASALELYQDLTRK